ncbi:TetR/AcrR family transcriptional regulator [Blastococcus sp. TF02-8]|uniref:TetR/AcrR family transcriptional regulator n=1 Tax=Blastococcus sp. TF02-8 TaxID=2250574 RepID=UPI00197AF0B6|nr:TetR/AcrR family transcriptional regulator [Blastococcus sp. TF02-8]
MRKTESEKTPPARRGPGRPRRDAGARPTRERVLEAATALFAERGVEGVAVRDIAERVGIDVSSVHHHFPTKTALYEACFAAVFSAERDALDAEVERLATALATGDRDQFVGALHALIDAFATFLEEHPETTFLWLRRWLDPAAATALDEAYALPIYSRIEDALLTAAGRGLIVEPTPHVTVRSLVWAAHGHVTSLSAIARDPVAAGRERREFRAFAHRFIDRLYPDRPASPS